jgi:hypothetical protein
MNIMLEHDVSVFSRWVHLLKVYVAPYSPSLREESHPARVHPNPHRYNTKVVCVQSSGGNPQKTLSVYVRICANP